MPLLVADTADARLQAIVANAKSSLKFSGPKLVTFTNVSAP
jgi:hypothetical protein